jgi:3-hydroxyacyl-CoA dehydrogenase / 3-hydroxy-2-methylbutyryl-CoA dehydrogenase
MKLDKCVALITGGSSGLGAACVKQFTTAGASVVIADVNPNPPDFIKEVSDKVRFVQTDVTQSDQVQKAIDTAWDTFKNLNVVINCAGIGIPEKMVNRKGAAYALENFQKIINVNLVGSFNVARLASASIAKNNPDVRGELGVIIHTASIAAFEGQRGQVGYSASKGGIVGLTLPMARDLGPLGIRVVTIAPGVFETPMVAELSDKVREGLAQMTVHPKRLGLPKDYAALAQHIIENEMLNGTTIRLDGAMRMAK